MGAPVVAFCRIDDKPIRLREPVLEPDTLIVQDPTLFHAIDVFHGLAPQGHLLINTSRPIADLDIENAIRHLPEDHVCCVPATEIALKYVKRPVPNAVLLGALCALIDGHPHRVGGEGHRGQVSRPRRSGKHHRREGGVRTRQGGLHPGESPCLNKSKVRAASPQAVALCRPQVICAYPITPQTHIVEDLGAMVKGGTLANCEFINVESEFAALSVAIGSSATGARSYTATASQGLLFMAEAVYNASGLGLPIVMTVGNRAIGAPINIWNDQSDSMALRDAGWIQLYAESNQQAVDVHIQAFRIAETLSLPVMVCMDGFILTHAFEGIDVPTQEQVDGFLPPYEPRQILDPNEPISLGAMVGPEAFTEVRYLAHYKQMQALDLIPQIAAEFQQCFGRESGGLIATYRNDDAETIVITLGSVIGTVEEVIDELRDQGHAIGAVTLRAFRPFPHAALLAAIGGAKRVVVLEKSLAVGMGGIVSNNVHMTLHGSQLPIYSVIAGLGGRPITRKSLRELFLRAMRDDLERTEFLDLKTTIVKRELEREQQLTRPGSTAENILREMGVVDAAKTA